MDDLTPMDPEYREAPPETPQETPCYYGTGRQPEQRPSHLPIIIVLICLLGIANFVTVFALLELKRTQAAAPQPGADITQQFTLLPADESSEPSENDDLTLSRSDENALSLHDLYEKVIPSVVTVLSGNDRAGTGIVLSADGYILTNARTVQNASSLSVRTNDGETGEATLVGADSGSDLALLLVHGISLTPAKFGDSEQLAPGDSVVAFSNPFGSELGTTMSQGFIAAVNDNVELSGRQIGVLQTNASLNSDSAGGPLFNVCGQVIGINVSRVGSLVSYETVANIGFAIPTRDVKTILRDLLSGQFDLGHASLGLTVIDIPAGPQSYWNLPAGVMVGSIRFTGPAYAAGIRRGDVIVKLGDYEIAGTQDYATALDACIPGQSVRVYLYRGGKYYYADITPETAE